MKISLIVLFFIVISSQLSRSGRVSVTEIDACRDLCAELKRVVPQTQIALSCEEKRQIVAAMQLARGAWYKCPKGDCNIVPRFL